MEYNLENFFKSFNSLKDEIVIINKTFNKIDKDIRELKQTCDKLKGNKIIF